MTISALLPLALLATGGPRQPGPRSGRNHPVLTSSLSFERVRFGDRRGRTVVDSLDFAFPAGATVLLGPNGAGKSTLLGLGASALRPRSGRVVVDGVVAAGASLRTFRRRVAWMPQQIAPFPVVTVREQVAYVGWLKGMPRHDAWRSSVAALERVGLGGFEDRRAGELSGGELRRLGIAQTLVHGAAWILMDEPSAGLDPAQRAAFRRTVAALRGRVSCVISTHQTEDIDASYDWVVVLGAGRIRNTSAVGDFLELGGGDVVTAYERTLEGG